LREIYPDVPLRVIPREFDALPNQELPATHPPRAARWRPGDLLAGMRVRKKRSFSPAVSR
jgi:hypothetical protein